MPIKKYEISDGSFFATSDYIRAYLVALGFDMKRVKFVVCDPDCPCEHGHVAFEVETFEPA